MADERTGSGTIKAVVFDYGEVLTGPPEHVAHDQMVRLTGLPAEEFERYYWADRHAYDEGKLSGMAFWEKFGRDAGLNFTPERIAELNLLDAQHWTTSDPVMLAWHAELKRAGLKTGILSNMGDSVLENMEREFKWIHDFDVLVWSYQLGLAKPDAAIYKALLDRLGVPASETLFIDDRVVNVEAARRLGMKSVVFTTPAALRQELQAAEWWDGLPFPAIG